MLIWKYWLQVFHLNVSSPDGPVHTFLSLLKENYKLLQLGFYFCCSGDSSSNTENTVLPKVIAEM